MNALQRKIAKLERAIPAASCPQCRLMPNHFVLRPRPDGTYDEPVFPLRCRGCGKPSTHKHVKIIRLQHQEDRL